MLLNIFRVIYTLPYFIIWIFLYFIYGIILLFRGEQVENIVNNVIKKSAQDVNTIYVVTTMMWIYIILIISK
jgi:hypothetical protein